jgi:hypothetical protein
MRECTLQRVRCAGDICMRMVRDAVHHPGGSAIWQAADHWQLWLGIDWTVTCLTGLFLSLVYLNA